MTGPSIFTRQVLLLLLSVSRLELSYAWAPARSCSRTRGTLYLGKNDIPVLPTSTRQALIHHKAEPPLNSLKTNDHWHVWRTAERLEQYGLSSSLPAEDTHELTKRVVSILRQWAEKWAGEKDWHGLLNKKSLLHEVEESIVALHLFILWINANPQLEPLICVDVCCGKGVFSMLASYIFQDDPRVQKIIMLDKAIINWNHIEAANKNASQDNRPMIESWGGCNLHDTDEIVNRLEDLQSPVALVGIHLCKMLSPTCVGIVNAMGPCTCPFLCLAPCCMPRAVTNKHEKKGGSNAIIKVPQYESPHERQTRCIAARRRDDAMQRGSVLSACYICQSLDHPIHKCALLPTDEKEKIEIFRKAAGSAPCWKCGIVGHFKADCPSNQTAGKPTLIKAPVACMNVSEVLKADKPFDTYCEILSETLQRDVVLLVETGLLNDAVQHQEGNWNGGRKSIYIVATK